VSRPLSATDPAALIAQLAAQQVKRSTASADPCATPLALRARNPERHSGRAVANLIMQVVARTERRAEGVLSAELLRPTLPAGAAPRNARHSSCESRGTRPRGESDPHGTVSGESPTVLLIDDVQAVVVRER